MEKLFKLFCIIVIIILLVTIRLSSAIKNDMNSMKKDTNALDNSELNSDFHGDNVLKSYESKVILDDDNDGSMDSYGDKSMTFKEAKEKYKLYYNLEVYDSDGNSKLDPGEITPAKLTITNDSDKDYIIQEVKIDAKAPFFNESSFSNIKSTNTGNATYSFENSILTTNEQGYKIPSKGEAVYEWDIEWTKDKDETYKKYLTSTPYDFINVEFIAYTGKEKAIYYTLENQKFQVD